MGVIKQLMVLMAVMIWASGAIRAQVSNPIPEPVIKRGLTVQIQEIARLPETRERFPERLGRGGFARVSFVRDIADGRRFANDSRGFLYLLSDNNPPSEYADVGAAFPFADYSRLESGFIGFDFHPDFAQNGLFYTVHGEVAEGNPAQPDFIPPGYTAAEVNHHNVITEWHTTDPASNTFQGTRRELLRVGQTVMNMTHPFGFVGFNPTAEPGDPDYGLLYTSGSDLGFSNGGGPNANNPSQTQRLDTVTTAILRFDPRSPSQTGGTKGLGDYTIPEINMFHQDGDPNTLGEIYAYGFRNAHRHTWDLTDGTMYAFDIGMSHIEEVNIVREGNNYGWMTREGYWDNGVNQPGGGLREVYPLPDTLLDGEIRDEFTYPVAIYDHNEGRSITGGVAYHGRIPALRGKLVFGDIQRGRIFAADLAAIQGADDDIPRTVAPVEEIQLYTKDSSGRRTYVTMHELIQATLGESTDRADLHIGQSRDGEIFITSRQDGTIRMLVPDSD